MKTMTFTTLTTLALLATPALASSSYCNEPQDKWMARDDASAKVTAMGYQVRNMKVDDGCYEAYAIGKDGRKLEIYINPVTAEVVKMKEED